MPIDLVVAGAAAKTTVPAGMTLAVPGAGGTFTVASAAGYPASGKFAVTINRGLADEEKILINSRSGAVFTVGQRGYDSTSAADHPGTPTCELSFPATVLQTLIDHENGTQPDPHPTTLLNNARHDITARHQFGAALGTPGTPTALTPDIAGAAGVGTVPARSDHTHNVPAGTASTITGTNAEGVGASFARLDHNHQVGGTNHIPGAALVNDSVGLTQLANGIILSNSDLFADSGQRLPYVRATAPPSPVAGDIWYNTTKGSKLLRNAANTQWEVLEVWGPGFQYTPTLFNCSVGAGTNTARYTRQGNVVIINGFLSFVNPGASTNGNPIGVGLPSGVTAKDVATGGQFYYHGAARAFDLPAGGAYAAVGLIRGGVDAGSGAAFDRLNLFATAGSPAWKDTVPFTWDGGTSDGFSWFAQFEPSSLVDANFT